MSGVGEFVRVISAGEVPFGEGRTVEAAGRRIAVFNTKDGWFALDDLCPHAGGSLGEGHVAAGCVACPLHFWEFDLRTGEYTDDPDTGVQPYEVKVEGGEVLGRVG